MDFLMNLFKNTEFANIWGFLKTAFNKDFSLSLKNFFVSQETFEICSKMPSFLEIKTIEW